MPKAYTASVLKYKPSPIPTSHLAAMNIPIPNALASRAAPTAKTIAPRTIARVRPKLSDMGPAKIEPNVAESSIDEMTMPCKVEESAPKVSVKEGMAVTELIVPVSRLKVQLFAYKSVNDDDKKNAVIANHTH